MIFTFPCALLVLAAVAIGPSLAAPSGHITPTRLQCESAVDPLGVDTAAPRLSWIVTSDMRDQRQSAYEIRVATSQSVLESARPDLWDSGKILSPDTLGVVYGGKPLETAERAFWSVRVWDGNGRASAWSTTAEWTMGVVRDADWVAKWIKLPEGADSATDSTLLRQSFTVKHGLVRALAFVCGLGQYELSVNGSKVGDDVLAPGWTDYAKTCLYDARDITGELKLGGNAVGLILGNGMYNVHAGRYTKFVGSFGPQKAIAQIRLEYADGTVQIVGTDGTWQAHSGPITFSSVYGGEDFDARLVAHGWDTPSFDDSHWSPAEVTTGPGGALKGLSCAAPPIRMFETFSPVSVTPIRPGVTVYDLGQNASQMIRLVVHGSAGSSVTITPAELIHADGTVDRGSVGGGEAYWKYTLAGIGHESYFPKFFYHGCRYLQVEVAAPDGGSLPVVDSLKGVVVGADAPAIGTFHCSNDLFNKIFTLVRWAHRSNTVSVLTDCPTRERLGWLEESHLNGPSLRYNFDLARNYRKIENDMADAQTADGLVPDIAPEYSIFGGGFRDSAEWGSAVVLNAWQQYQFTGDSSLLAGHFDTMERYVDHLTSRAKGGILDYGLGDWYDLGPKHPGFAQLTPVGLTATAFWYEDATIVAKTATLLGKTAEAQKYGALADTIKASFNQTYWNDTTGEYATGSDTANAIPLVMGLAPDSKRAELVEKIVSYIAAHNGSFTAGDVGYRYVLTALAQGGRSDIIYAMNNQSERPGYGMQLSKGATSLTEAWDAGRSSSQNHFMLGQINEWLYANVAGIAVDPSSPGFLHFIVAPSPVGDLTSASATYDSVRGLIAVSWQRDAGVFVLDVTVPANTTATVRVPVGPQDVVREGGKALGDGAGFWYRKVVGEPCEVRVGSGHYHFESR